MVSRRQGPGSTVSQCPERDAGIEGKWHGEMSHGSGPLMSPCLDLLTCQEIPLPLPDQQKF